MAGLKSGSRRQSVQRNRRRQNKEAASAELLLDRRLEGDCVVLSDDLYQELFSSQRDLNGNEDTQSHAARYVAITYASHLDLDRLDTVQWVIMEARAHSAGFGTIMPHGDSTVWCSYDHAAVTHLVQDQPITRLAQAGKTSSGMAIRILETIPCVLDAIYVDFECLPDRGVLLDHLRNGASLLDSGGNESTVCLGGDTETKTDNAPDAPASVADVSSAMKLMDTARFKDALRKRFKEYLRPPKVLRSGDIYALPFSTAVEVEIYAKVALCDPVTQGVVGDTTLLVLRLQQGSIHGVISISNTDTQHSNGKSRPTVIGKSIRELGPVGRVNLGINGADAARDSRQGPDSGSGYDSSDPISPVDDSDEDMISLDLPPIPARISGLGGTPVLDVSQPRKPNLQRHPLPAASGPSTPSTSSGRQGGRPFEIFKVLDLRRPIANALLYPLPARDDDPEARLYVGARALIRLHCFSGDWVTLEPALALASDQYSAGSIDVGPNSQEIPRRRIARIYAIPEGYAPPSAKDQLTGGIGAFAATTRASRTQPWPAYMPGILLINLNYPRYLHVTPLRPRPPDDANHLGPHKLSSPSTCLGSPPSAKEVTLLKLSTPFSGEWASQPLLLLSLKKYFSKKRRLVKCGDMIGVHVDTGIGRLAYQARLPADRRPEVLELLKASLARANDNGHVDDRFREFANVAWFEIGGVIMESTHHQEGTYTEVWGGIVTVDPSITRIVQTGNLQGRLPRKPQAATTSLDGSDQVDPSSGLSKESSTGPVPPEGRVSPKQRLKELVAAAVNPMAMTLHLEPLVLLLHSQQRGVGKTMTARRACSELGLHVFVIDALDIVSTSSAGGGNVQNEVLLTTRLERAMSCGPAHCAILVEHVEALAADRVLTALSDFVSSTRIFIATTTDVENVPPGLRAIFSYELEVPVPDERGRRELLQDIIKDKDVPIAYDVDLSAVTTKTAALAAADLVDVVDRAMAARALRVASLCDRLNLHRPRAAQMTLHDLHLAGGDAVRCVTGSDLDEAVDAARKNFSDSIGTPKIPTVNWEDVGGLTHVKEAVVETIQLPLEHPELFVKGMKKRSGILFYGPPGTGKTLLAKAIATEFSLNFFSVKGPELLNMYVGESEANVRRVFQRARDARPCVVFFDELDSVAPKRGNQGDSGGVMDRIVSQLLAELDGMSDGQASAAGGVFVVGATNRPDLLDPALLRPGRFDKMLYLGISDTHEKQLKILQALTRKFDLDPALSLERISEGLPYTYSGADIYALCSDAMLKAIARKVSALEAKVGSRADDEPVSVSYYLDHMATEDDTAVVVAEEDFVAAQRDLVGSVSAKELEHYDRIRRAFKPEVTGSKAPS